MWDFTTLTSDLCRDPDCNSGRAFEAAISTLEKLPIAQEVAPKVEIDKVTAQEITEALRAEPTLGLRVMGHIGKTLRSGRRQPRSIESLARMISSSQLSGYLGGGAATRPFWQLFQRRISAACAYEELLLGSRIAPRLHEMRGANAEERGRAELAAALYWIGPLLISLTKPHWAASWRLQALTAESKGITDSFSHAFGVGCHEFGRLLGAHTGIPDDILRVTSIASPDAVSERQSVEGDATVVSAGASAYLGVLLSMQQRLGPLPAMIKAVSRRGEFRAYGTNEQIAELVSSAIDETQGNLASLGMTPLTKGAPFKDLLTPFLMELKLAIQEGRATDNCQWVPYAVWVSLLLLDRVVGAARIVVVSFDKDRGLILPQLMFGRPTSEFKEKIRSFESRIAAEFVEVGAAQSGRVTFRGRPLFEDATVAAAIPISNGKGIVGAFVLEQCGEGAFSAAQEMACVALHEVWQAGVR